MKIMQGGRRKVQQDCVLYISLRSVGLDSDLYIPERTLPWKMVVFTVDQAKKAIPVVHFRDIE